MNSENIENKRNIDIIEIQAIAKSKKDIIEFCRYNRN
jgi:hypothetical protein